MKLLGVSAGAPGGSAEILLKAALMSAESAGAEVKMVRIDDLRVPSGPAPDVQPDDCPWLWEQLMDCQGIIYSAPIYSRMMPGKLHAVADRIFGPHADAGLMRLQLRRRAAGEPLELPFEPDERTLAPRVAGLIAVGGALTPQWWTLALPMLASLTFPMRNGVVDQVRFFGAGTPRSIVLDEPAIARAARLGANVAGQLGRAYEDVAYVGEPGLCPTCHLSLIDVRGDVVECATCGAEGRFEVRDGRVGVVFGPAGLDRSVVSDAEKESHAMEIFQTAARHRGLHEQIEAAAARYDEWDRTITPSAPAHAG